MRKNISGEHEVEVRSPRLNAHHLSLITHHSSWLPARASWSKRTREYGGRATGPSKRLAVAFVRSVRTAETGQHYALDGLARQTLNRAH